MTKFKAGDRVVRRNHICRVVSDNGKTARVRRTDSLEEDWSAIDVHVIDEPAPPPPDTRKRLREYTDLADGDVAVIAGVPLTIKNNGFHSELRTCALGYESIADFFVDEVRRKPRTKKRRVYEEQFPDAAATAADFLKIDGHLYALVEETEVPR